MQDGFSSREPNGAGSTCGHVGKSQAEKQEECEALAIGAALVLWHIVTRDIASAWVICWAAAGTRNNLRLTHVKQATLVPVHALQTPSLVLAEGPKHFKPRPRTHAQKPWYSCDGTEKFSHWRHPPPFCRPAAQSTHDVQRGYNAKDARALGLHLGSTNRKGPEQQIESTIGS